MKKVLLGLITIYPFVYLLFFMSFIFSTIFSISGNFNEEIMGGVFPIIFILHFLTIFVIIGLTIFYIIHAIKNESINKDMRLIWILVIFMGNMISMPIYWYIYIWSNGKLNQNK